LEEPRKRIEDLSRHHQPVSGLFTRPARPADWEAYRLSAEQLDFFHENGYLKGVRILSDEQIEVLRAELEQLMNVAHEGHHLFHEYHSNESTDPSRVVFHALGAWRILPGFHDLLWNPAFLVPASYWTRTRPLAHLTCWIGLDDSTRENGCLNYVPGSHKWPDLAKPVLTGEMDGIRENLPEELKEKFKPVAVELKKGESSFHHARTMHGSRANDTPAPRRATVINVFRDGVMSDTNEPLLAGVPVIPRGEKMGGQFFPLLFDPAMH